MTVYKPLNVHRYIANDIDHTSTLIPKLLMPSCGKQVLEWASQIMLCKMRRMLRSNCSAVTLVASKEWVVGAKDSAKDLKSLDWVMKNLPRIKVKPARATQYAAPKASSLTAILSLVIRRKILRANLSSVAKFGNKPLAQSGGNGYHQRHVYASFVRQVRILQRTTPRDNIGHENGYTLFW